LNKLNNVNVNYLKSPKKHRGPHGARVFETLLLTLLLRGLSTSAALDLKPERHFQASPVHRGQAAIRLHEEHIDFAQAVIEARLEIRQVLFDARREVGVHTS